MNATALPGITEIGGRPYLPSDPEIAVEALAELLGAAREGSISATDFADRARVRHGLGRAHSLALIGWLPRSGVGRLRADGALDLHPGTHLQDLAARLAAWVGQREVPADRVGARQQWCDTLVRRAQSHPLALDRETADRQAARDWIDAAPTTLGSGVSAGAQPPITHKIRRILTALDTALIERQTHSRAVLLALLAGQHALLLGPPGTAKSLLARSLCGVFDQAEYFEYLLSRFTHPDELFGPVSIPGLKDEDYRRLTQGFLPKAHVAFLDEIFKANSAILNSLLTLINERVFHHGRHRDPVPLLGVIGASNELPEPGAGLDALYDRFLVRLTVPPLADPDAFLRVATGDLQPLDLADEDRLQLSEIQALRQAARAVTVPETVRQALVALWDHARQAEWRLSDRRWRQAVDLLRVAAASEGRTQVEPVDLLLLEPCLVADPDRVAEAHPVLVELAQHGAAGSGSSRAVERAERLDPSVGPLDELDVQWALLTCDRVAPTADDPVPLGDPPSGWKKRLALRRASLDRLRAHHAAAVDRLTVARERATAAHGDRLWIFELPAQIMLPYLQAARSLGGLLERIDAYAASIASPAALVTEGVGWLATEDRLRPEFMDAVVTIGEIASVGLAYRQWRRLERCELEHATVVIEAEEWLDWLAGTRTSGSLLAGVDPKRRRALLTALPELQSRLAPTVIPEPPGAGVHR